MTERLGELRIKAPDELSGFLLRLRLQALGEAELVRLDEEGWEVQVHASGPGAVAAAVELTREWLATERIAATEVVMEGQKLTLNAPATRPATRRFQS
jgi:hypothetical protein